MIRVLGLATCYNRSKKTVNAINKLVKYNPNIRFHFIIVDDNSTDDTKQRLQYFPQVEVINGTGSMYYSGGMRLAIAMAKKKKEVYDYCLMFNDDVDFTDHSIEYLASLTVNTIWVGPTCGKDGKLSYGGIVKYAGWRPKYNMIKGENIEGQICDTFNANCVLIPWYIFKQLDNIDPVFTHSLGDVDSGVMARKAGFSIRVAQQYVGFCDDNPSIGSWRDTTIPRGERLRRKESPKGLPFKEYFHYLKKNYGMMTAMIYSAIPYLRILFGK